VSSKSAEFNKYAETDDEDYDDVFFAKPSGQSECIWRALAFILLIKRQRHHHSNLQRASQTNRGLV
jgi:hypothetical protein